MSKAVTEALYRVFYFLCLALLGYALVDYLLKILN